MKKNYNVTFVFREFWGELKKLFKVYIRSIIKPNAELRTNLRLNVKELIKSG